MNTAIDELNKALQNLTDNQGPVANAGPDQTITAGQSVILNGSGTDSDGTIVAYLWSTGATTQNVTVSPASTTAYTLKVKDNSGNWSSEDSVTVTVNAPAPPPPPANNPPVA